MEVKILLGVIYTHQFEFNQGDVINFSKASGDLNPIHLDDEYAKTTIFKKKIIHGFLGGSIFSKVFGTLFPGMGTIYLKQEMVFYRPMFIDTIYEAKFTVIDIILDKNRALVKTEIYDMENKLIIGGEALVQHSNIK